MHFNLHKYLYKSEQIIDDLQLKSCNESKKIF